MTALESIELQVSEILNRLKPTNYPDVYINTEEACRQLEITPPTLASFSKEGLLKEHNNSYNKYLLSEIMWLKGKNFRGLRGDKFQALINEKKAAFA